MASGDAPRRHRKPPTASQPIRLKGIDEARAEYLLERLGHPVAAELSAEADRAVAEVERRTQTVLLAFPERFAVEHESGRLLYLLTRLVRPGLMVETGVANGASTLLVLTALARNGTGTLISVVVSEEVGSLFTEEEQHSTTWDLRIIEPGGLTDVLAGLGQVDVFLHDSDHSYANVASELAAAWPRMAPGGLVLTDDGEMSCAFLDAADAQDATPYGLFDRRKMFMVAVA